MSNLVFRFLSAIVIALAIPGAAAFGGDWFSLTGVLNCARENHTATLLPGGDVLIAGGWDRWFAPTYTAEIFDHVSGGFSYTSGWMNVCRAAHTATLLPGGQVLIAGGVDFAGQDTATAEIYDPATGTFALTGSMNEGRSFHTAVALPGGRVMVIGGYSPLGGCSATAEIYDPAAGNWKLLKAELNEARADHVTVDLRIPAGPLQGALLIAGGADDDTSCELYIPRTNQFVYTGSMNDGREEGAAACLMPNGSVLIAGGFNMAGAYSMNAEVYDPATGTCAVAAMGYCHNYDPTLTILPATGRILLAGGDSGGCRTSEEYDSFTNTFGWARLMNIETYRHTATALPIGPYGGTVLVVGGLSPTGITDRAELYYP